MAKAAKEQSNYERYKKNSRVYRHDSQGVKCPKCTFLRDSSRGLVWYAKITIGGKQKQFNTEILERDRGSREAVIAWIEQNKPRLIALHEGKLASKLPNPRIEDIELPVVFNPRSVVFVTKLERDKQIKLHAGSPNIPTVNLQLDRICTYFGHETDVTTITMDHVTAYVEHRRTQLYRGNAPAYKTIYREIDSFTRAIRRANNRRLFGEQPYFLPIDTDDRRALCELDGVNEKQRSHQYAADDCDAWIDAAKGTDLEHYVYLAYATGMRSFELENLCMKWVYKVKGQEYPAEIRMPQKIHAQTKLDERPVPLTEELYARILMLAEGKGMDERLLPPTASVSHWSDVIAERANRMRDDGTPLRITLRDLRASFGRRVYDETGNIFLTQHAMRHKNIKTTQEHYVRGSQVEWTAIARARNALHQRYEEKKVRMFK